MGSAPQRGGGGPPTSHPVKQGLVQMLSVFIDTILICSTTALHAAPLSGVPIDAYSEGMNFVQAAVQPGGPRPLVHHCLHLPCSPSSSLVGNYYYTESNFRFHPGLQDRLRCSG